MSSAHRLAIARLMVGLVLFFNVQCGLVFLVFPQNFVGNFELNGIPGQAMVQALGLLFIMWNVPYAAALIQPIRNRNSHLQAIGLAGEMWMLIGLAAGHDTLRITVLRFIGFDSFGLLALSGSFWLLRPERTA